MTELLALSLIGWAVIGAVVCFIYMAATNQLEGGFRAKCWEEVIPNTFKRVGFIIILGPIVIFVYSLDSFFKWLRKA